MGLFEKIFKPRQREAATRARAYFRTLTAYQPHFTTWDGALYEVELVRSAIDARARAIGKLKIDITGKSQPALQKWFRLQPNPWQSWSQFLYRVSTILDVTNNVVIVPIFDNSAMVAGYYPVLPERCELVDVDGEIWMRYRFATGAVGACEYSKCVVLTKFQYQDDFFGSSNMALNKTMQLKHLQNEAITEAVKAGASYRFMAQVKNFLHPEDIAEERDRFNLFNFGEEEQVKDSIAGEYGRGHHDAKKKKGHRTGVLLFPNTYSDVKQIESKPYTISPEEAQQIRTNVFDYFSVNEDILQSKAIGDIWNAFHQSVTEWFAIQFAEAFTRAIFSDRERAYGSAVTVTASRLQYVSNKEKKELTDSFADRGMALIDELRALWDLPPLPNGLGQVVPRRGEYHNVGDEIEKGQKAEGEDEDDQK